MDDADAIVDFLFEVGILAKTPRSGFHFLGSGEQSVAEHVARVLFIGYALSHMRPGVDRAAVLRMCLLHDIAETRTSDLNYVHQRYAEANEAEAVRDIAESVPFGEDIRQTVAAYEARVSEEALLAKDADTLELILSLKEQADIGNRRAATWLERARQRLRTPEARALGERIALTDSDRWWFSDPGDVWWVSRGGPGTDGGDDDDGKEAPDGHPRAP